MFKLGYWELGRMRGIPVRVHWTMPVGALIFGGLSPAFWLAFVVLVLLHEMGHAVLVRRYGHRVLAIDITGFGGLCRWSGETSQYQRSVIAWGGVAAQALLLVAALLVVLVTGWPASLVGRQLMSAFISTNGLLIALNLLPVRPFDGFDAWWIVRRALDRTRDSGRGRIDRSPR